MAAEGGNIIWFTYTGVDGEVIDEEATHISVQAGVVRARTFRLHRNIVEVNCHEKVEKIEQYAFTCCRSLRRVIMRGVKIVEEGAFDWCKALEDVQCDKLETIRQEAFNWCVSLKNINLPSARIVHKSALWECHGLTNVKFGNKLESIEECAFENCESLEQITIPLKDGFIRGDDTFRGCHNLHRVHLVEGELHETIAALHLEEWRNDMNKEIDLINLILPNAAAGWWDDEYGVEEPGEKAQTIRRWIRSVLLKITRYQAEHHRLLNEAESTLELILPNNDILVNNILPFLNLPPYTFELGNDEDDI